MIRISDLYIPIKSATLDLLFSGDELTWGFTIDAGRFTNGDVDWPSVRVDSAGVFTTPKRTLNHWTDLGKKSTTWGQLEDNDVIPHAMIYVFEHELVHNGIATIEMVDSGIHLELSGKCNVYFDERYDTDLDLNVNSDLKLGPIMCGGDDEDECFRRLGQHLDTALFSYAQTDRGVSMLIAKGAG